MSVTIALGFPVLDEDGSSFADGVRYMVAATIQGMEPPKTLTVEHRLTGFSFVRDWICSGDARFSTRLLFRHGARREVWPFEGKWKDSGNALVAKQRITVRFVETPEVACSIVAINNRELVVSHPESGLSDFWRARERLFIPCYARIGHHTILNFDDGSLARLIHVVPEKNLSKGQMKTEISQHAPEGKKPVTLLCAEDVFDELRAFTEAPPLRHREAMRSAFVTQALCAIYGYMEILAHDNQYNEVEINPTLRSHGQELKERTGTTWGEDGFNPSLAATQMRPYVILRRDYADDED